MLSPESLNAFSPVNRWNAFTGIALNAFIGESLECFHVNRLNAFIGESLHGESLNAHHCESLNAFTGESLECFHAGMNRFRGESLNAFTPVNRWNAFSLESPLNAFTGIAECFHNHESLNRLECLSPVNR
ncbi:hypothetical protein H6P81_021751 [Aristolochia fimbriata]|uniref:Uncharacterized protein n=1 Tax=Aristolochia fimbriata TaxID=158543 RepID=A0AAV7DQ30_ARIFI|nr:hypothetical protein H6P81_021751 [Aristolochia fimbriata]